MRLGDAVLPPWANGSPDEFVRVMREALESDVVSQVNHGGNGEPGWLLCLLYTGTKVDEGHAGSAGE